MADGVRIRPAVSAAELNAVRALCRAYRDFLLHQSDTDRYIVETFYPEDSYARLMDRLAQEHVRPRGIILLAADGDTPVGCGMTHAIDATRSEIKRVFVTPGARGGGVAATLCKALMAQAREDGFQSVVLDTSRSLVGAQQLYTRLGFAPRGPYQDIPADVRDHLLFYEARL